LVGNAIYATRLKGGWVKEFGRSHEVPINDRFYLGGANSIRGFRENSIGPRNASGSNVGANAYAIFNQELRFPLFWKFWGSFFTDMGNGWESFADARPENILFSYGAGFQFVSPAGPIRLDYAHHLENGVYKEDDRLHFTILYAF
jgi:outer membrane protein insertion porin family